MTNNEVLQADLLDILFENRNKAYGAYALRRTYHYRLYWALGISLSLSFLLAMCLISSQKNSFGSINKDKPLELSVVEFPADPKKPDPPNPDAHRQQAQATYTDQIAFVNDEPNMPTQTDLQAAQISDVTADGLPPDGIVANPDNSNHASEIENASDQPVIDKTLPSYEAQFPGGAEKFTEFLRKYLNTPADLEAGEKKVVIIRFMVDAEGSISKTEIVQSGGEKYDNEVIRVLRKMPKWIPAVQNGIKVATYFTQPVTFIGLEE